MDNNISSEVGVCAPEIGTGLGGEDAVRANGVAVAIRIANDAALRAVGLSYNVVSRRRLPYSEPSGRL